MKKMIHRRTKISRIDDVYIWNKFIACKYNDDWGMHISFQFKCNAMYSHKLWHG